MRIKIKFSDVGFYNVAVNRYFFLPAILGSKFSLLCDERSTASGVPYSAHFFLVNDPGSSSLFEPASPSSCPWMHLYINTSIIIHF